jgi:ribosome-binding factor A|tara:strand:- start:2351 stop:2683 length:333 start_codon:yes stop_codon:yes gene_type:complete
MTDRIKKLEKRFLESIATWVIENSGDNMDLKVITLQTIKISRDLSHARVTISSAMDVRKAITFLNGNSGSIKRHLSKVMQLKRVPSLDFSVDLFHLSALEVAAIQEKYQE